MPSGSKKKNKSAAKGITSDTDSSGINEKKPLKFADNVSVRSTSPEVEEPPSRKARKRKISTSGSDVDAPRVKEERPKKDHPQEEVNISDKVQDYLDKHKDLSTKTLTKQHPNIKIYPEEEVFIFQCHKSLNPEKFLGQKINLPGKTKMKEEGLLFTVNKLPEDSTKTVTVVSCQEGSLRADTFPVAGKITLTQMIEKQNISYENAQQDNAHEEFPTNLKVRHPLLGVNFEDKLAELQNIVIKTESPERSPQKKSKRKRDSSPTRPAKKIKEEISEDLQWIQNV
uniref:Uncharacterized protein n=1 Tax=Nyssomyia neivai TaxID=330878 RepID=A0A1L8D8S1_9DIPT